MATITPLQYAKNYWDMQVPIVDDTTEKVKEWVTVRVDSYRLKADEAAMNDFMSKARPRLDQKDGRKRVSEKRSAEAAPVAASEARTKSR